MKKVKMISTCALLAVIGMTVGGLSLKTAKANGDLYDGFELVGASVRMVEPTGIRFHTNVPEEIKDAYTFGTLIVPVADLGDNELTVLTPNAANVILGENGKWQPKESYGPWCYTSVLAGVNNGESILAFPKSQYNAQIAARSYALDENGNVVYYTNTQTRSVAYVASCALATTAGEGLITDETSRTTLTGMVDYALGNDGFAFASDSVEIANKNKVDLSALFAKTNGNEGMVAIWEVTGNCLSLEYDENGIATGAIVNGEGTATLTATIGSTTKELTVTVDLTEWYKTALQFNSQDSLSIVENSYVKDGFPNMSIVQDGDRSVLSGVFTAKDKAGYEGTLTIGIGGQYKASEIESIVITFRVPEVVGTAGSTYYYAGANVSSSGSSAGIGIKSAAISNGKPYPVVTTDYITMTIAGDLLVTALGNGDTIVNNIALWNSTKNSAGHPVNIYIDGIVINLVEEEPEVVEKDLLQFNDDDSLSLIQNAWSDEANGYEKPSIKNDGDRTVLAASYSGGSYAATLTLGLGRIYDLDEIESIVITYRRTKVSKADAWIDLKVSGNRTTSGHTELYKYGIKNTQSEYATITISGDTIRSKLSSKSETLDNLAIWSGTSNGQQHGVIYIDSIVINLV